MISAQITAKKEMITTAPAARSFAFPINGSWSVLTLSANFLRIKIFPFGFKTLKTSSNSCSGLSTTAITWHKTTYSNCPSWNNSSSPFICNSSALPGSLLPATASIADDVSMPTTLCFLLGADKRHCLHQSPAGCHLAGCWSYSITLSFVASGKHPPAVKRWRIYYKSVSMVYSWRNGGLQVILI